MTAASSFAALACVALAGGCAATYDAHWATQPAATAPDSRAAELAAAGDALWAQRDDEQEAARARRAIF